MIEIAIDPRVLDSEWLDNATGDAPQETARNQFSHNAADVVQELIRIGLSYILLVSNPFVISVASEAGKQACAVLHQWLRRPFAYTRTSCGKYQETPPIRQNYGKFCSRNIAFPSIAAEES